MSDALLATYTLQWLAQDFNRLMWQMNNHFNSRLAIFYEAQFDALAEEIRRRPEYKSGEALFSADNDVRKAVKRLMELEQVQEEQRKNRS